VTIYLPSQGGNCRRALAAHLQCAARDGAHRERLGLQGAAPRCARRVAGEQPPRPVRADAAMFGRTTLNSRVSQMPLAQRGMCGALSVISRTSWLSGRWRTPPTVLLHGMKECVETGHELASQLFKQRRRPGCARFEPRMNNQDPAMAQ